MALSIESLLMAKRLLQKLKVEGNLKPIIDPLGTIRTEHPTRPTETPTPEVRSSLERTLDEMDITSTDPNEVPTG